MMANPRDIHDSKRGFARKNVKQSASEQSILMESRPRNTIVWVIKRSGLKLIDFTLGGRVFGKWDTLYRIISRNFANGPPTNDIPKSSPELGDVPFWV